MSLRLNSEMVGDSPDRMIEPAHVSFRAGNSLTVAIQGELGSNSHLAVLRAIETNALDEREETSIACSADSRDVLEALCSGKVDAAVLPIENSLHGSIAEHYDLLLLNPICIVGEVQQPVRHAVIAAPGVRLENVRRILSHPVALSQCRTWLREQPLLEIVSFYDTAGSVKHIMEQGLRDAAGIAPAIAAQQYGAEVLLSGVEDHTRNYTRFLVLQRLSTTSDGQPKNDLGQPSSAGSQRRDKMSLAFTVEHRPGALLRVLEIFQKARLDLTKIESRPVQDRPWEYCFFVDLRFTHPEQVRDIEKQLAIACQMVRNLGVYVAARNPLSREE